MYTALASGRALEIRCVFSLPLIATTTARGLAYRRVTAATLPQQLVPRSAGDEAWRRGENACAAAPRLVLKKFARADHHDILEKRRLGNADADSTRASESRRSDAVEFYWSQTSSNRTYF